MGRNTPILKTIIHTLSAEIDDTEYAVDQLESNFHDHLLVNAGSVTTISTHAQQLRSRISREECSIVLDHLAQQKKVGITVDDVETAINELFEYRFIGP